MSLNVNTHAKINLFLQVTAKRFDGYHQISSVFHNISLHDKLSIELSPDAACTLKLDKASTVSIPEECKQSFTQQNLISRIHTTFVSEHSVGGVTVRLSKHIPIGAGLGGGSANAAGMIYAMKSLYNLPLSPSKLLHIAKQFGSDIPYAMQPFLSQREPSHAKTALVEGVGDIITPISAPIRSVYLVLVYPDLPISTKEAYHAHLSIMPASKVKQFLKVYMTPPSRITDDMWLRQCSEHAHNCFEAKTFERYPLLSRLSQRMKTYTPYVLMSGSGSSLYAVFTSLGEAQALYTDLKQDYSHVSLNVPIQKNA